MEPERPPRLILVSNRLPATFQLERQKVKITPSAGGLATGLRTPHEKSGGTWIGWPGDVQRLNAEQLADLEAQLAARRLEPIYLTPTEVERYYHGYSNVVLWPLFHYLTDRLPLESSDWEAYRKVNERFADLVVEHYREGDQVWVHDYQLLLVPELLRRRLPEARIGFFLHIPFPASEVFRILPARREILQGLLGADLIGFHTHSYMRHFSMSLLRLLGIEASIDRLWHEGREIRLGIYPMGIDAKTFEEYSRDAKIRKEADSLRKQFPGTKIILGVDRLDYTKGLLRRMKAFERLLENEPSLRERVRLIQVAILSRTEVKVYKAFKEELDGLVGRINGRFASAHHTPIQYLNRSFSQKELAAFYLAADVMMVTPLRDGLNLVAKEYVACQGEEGGVLVLSEFAGASAELAEAMIVNPYDIDAIAAALAQALRMGPAERSARLQPMKKRVQTYDVHRWVENFLEDLSSISLENARISAHYMTAEVQKRIFEKLGPATRLVIFLDYDGTLVPHVPIPELASPDKELLEILQKLGELPRTAVHIVSGRDPRTLEPWLGRLPIHLHGEHGLWSRAPGDGEWVRNCQAGTEWMPKVRPILDRITSQTPGSYIEEKSSGLVWHYRRSDPVFGLTQAKELRLLLVEILSNVPVEVLTGDKVVEIRSQGYNKGDVAARVLSVLAPPYLAVAIGNDRTDEDLFAALPPDAWSIRVGPGMSKAPYRLYDHQGVRKFLRSIHFALQAKEEPSALQNI